MAFDTDKGLRNQVMYSVFVRNYSPEGTFEGVRKDLQRIRDLGVDIIWLMPIHPLGEKARKGSLGSPYAIKNYREVNPEFGTLEDFKALVSDIHALGMKCIIDVVYNHTSPDSWLSENHPEWFYHKPDGSFGNRVGDWTDIIDLDYANKELWDYQIDTLKMWAEIVDGFRCDVASLVPLEFWLRAREEVGKVRENCIWLSESIEHGFIRYIRSQGMTALSDSEIYQAFDISYEYDVAGDFIDCLLGKISLADYAKVLNLQETIYPHNYVKLRFLENHDRPRAHQLIADEKALRVWTAFMYFQKGMPLIYNGQETGATHLPTLFDKDTINFSVKVDLTPLMKKLYTICKDEIMTDSDYKVESPCDGVLTAMHTAKGGKLLGVFPVKTTGALVNVQVPDGTYKDLITGRDVEVHFGMLSVSDEAVIIRA
ncbi:MAG: alpha-amylase [Ruminococcaceae bacterium]|nr:alpha-amylase [Oscillospiraceae bacterium]